MECKDKKNRKAVQNRIMIGIEIILFLVMLVLIWKIGNYLIDDIKSRNYTRNLEQAVMIAEEKTESEGTSREQEAKEAEEQELEEAGEQEVEIPAAIDFDSLHEISQDAVAWLYCPETEINDVIAQSDDNNYYLRRLLNGTHANCGTLFVDYRNSPDFSDEITLIYGHNMKNGSMFASLMDYQNPGYYEEHPVMYLFTPEKRYQLELIAGYTTDTNDILYEVPATVADRESVLSHAEKVSSFISGVTAAPEDRLVILSTCSYAYDDARYVVIGRLIEESVTMDKENYPDDGQ